MWEQSPAVPYLSCQELALESLTHEGRLALPGKVRLSGEFLLGGLEAAALYQLELAIL